MLGLLFSNPLHKPNGHRTPQMVFRLTHILSHLFHDVSGDVTDWCVAEAFEEVAVTLQLRRADAAIVNMRIQGADEYQEPQQEQREDQFLHRQGHRRNVNSLLSKP